MLPPVLQRPVVKSAAHSQTLSVGIKRDQRRNQYIQLAKRENIAHVELRFADFQAIHHQIAARVVVEKQKIAGAERMQHGEIHPFARPPELINQRPRIQLAIKRQKYRDRMREQNRRVRHHSVRRQEGELRLLLRR